MKKTINNDIIFYGSKEIADSMGVSLPTARSIMNRQDFPLIKAGRNLRVEKNAFQEWCALRHV